VKGAGVLAQEGRLHEELSSHRARIEDRARDGGVDTDEGFTTDDRSDDARALADVCALADERIADRRVSRDGGAALDDGQLDARGVMDARAALDTVHGAEEAPVSPRKARECAAEEPGRTDDAAMAEALEPPVGDRRRVDPHDMNPVVHAAQDAVAHADEQLLGSAEDRGGHRIAEDLLPVRKHLRSGRGERDLSSKEEERRSPRRAVAQLEAVDVAQSVGAERPGERADQSDRAGRATGGANEVGQDPPREEHRVGDDEGAAGLAARAVLTFFERRDAHGGEPRSGDMPGHGVADRRIEHARVAPRRLQRREHVVVVPNEDAHGRAILPESTRRERKPRSRGTEEPWRASSATRAR
jgi:hypothetical protein